MASGQAWAWPGGPVRAQERPAETKLAAGRLLLATENINTPPFAQSVILLTNYGPGGALGVIINKPMSFLLARALPEVKRLRGSKESLYYGGPVSRNILTILMESDEDLTRGDGAIKVFGNVYFVANKKTINGAVGEKNQLYRGFAGYAGWAPGQLEYEIARGDWGVAGADIKTVFTQTPETLWEKFRRPNKDEHWAFIPPQP